MGPDLAQGADLPLGVYVPSGPSLKMMLDEERRYADERNAGGALYTHREPPNY